MSIEPEKNLTMEEEKPQEVVPAAEEAPVSDAVVTNAEDNINAMLPEEEKAPVAEEAPVAVAETAAESTKPAEEPSAVVLVVEAVVSVVPAASNIEVEEEKAEASTENKIITKVYNYGSCEMDQFWLPGQRSETRRPYLNALMENITVVQVACGSLHILLLTKEGLVYSSGLNDDGALGRADETATDDESDKKSK